VWEDDRAGNGDIYAQRIETGWGVSWLENGIPICDDGAEQSVARVVTNRYGDAIVSWIDERIASRRVYAQKVDASGAAQWPANGIPIGVNAVAGEFAVTADGFGGAVFVWRESATTDKLVAQRVSMAGALLWAASGVTVCDPGGTVGGYGLAADGNGGTIIAWCDDRGNVYTQRIDALGTPLWTTNGIDCSPGENPRIVPDGVGGAVVAWTDDRHGSEDVFAQRVDPSGSLMWDSNGLLVCGEQSLQSDIEISPDGNGGFVVVWIDERNGNKDVYAQRIDQNGFLGDPSPAITSVADSPGDQGGAVVISWASSYLDAPPRTDVAWYSIWRRNQAPAPAPEPTAVTGSGSDRALAAGITPVLASEMAQSGWAYVDTVLAFYLDQYAVEAPTFGDSSASGYTYTGFMVIAHTEDQFVFWKSDPDSGYSVDNLAPAPPMLLLSERIDADVRITWQPGSLEDTDLKHYAVYRDATSGFTTGPATFLGTSPDTTYLDTENDGWTYYYRTTGVDIHDNEGDASDELLVQGTAGIGIDDRTPALPERFTLHPNSPNPFNHHTEIRFGLPYAADVIIEVFDVAGRRVFSEKLTAVPEGWHDHTFRGVNERGQRLTNGVYFYKVSSGIDTHTRKMVIAR
jgi:hypothetical protein